MLEATVICIDNSEWSRNADFPPSRLLSQVDATNLISGSKVNQNPESVVGLLTLAGERVEVRVAPTQDLGKMLGGLHEIPIGGTADVLRGLQTAQLALKHRVNRNQKQRIVLFAGSPITASERRLVQLGRTLKKNNVALDIVSFGETEENSEKLKKLFDAVSSESGMCNFVECSSTASRLLTDVIAESAMLRDPQTGEMLGGADDLGAGVDPTSDPELYMALQLSLQEEQNRNARLGQSAAPPPEAAGDQLVPSMPSGTASQPATSSAEETGDPTLTIPPTAAEIAALQGIDDELRQALLLSLQEFNQQGEMDREATSGGVVTRNESVELAGAGDMGILPSEDASRPLDTPEAVAGSRSGVSSSAQTLSESGQAIHQMVTSLPGVDMNDRRLLEALQNVIAKSSEDEEREREPKDENEERQQQ